MGPLCLLLPILSLSANTLASFRLVPIASRLAPAPSSTIANAEPSPTPSTSSTQLVDYIPPEDLHHEELHWEKVETRRQEKELFEGLLQEVFRGKETKPVWVEELLQDEEAVVEQQEEAEKEVLAVSEEVLRDAMGWEWLSPPSNESEAGAVLREKERQAGREMYGVKTRSDKKVVGFDVDGNVLVSEKTSNWGSSGTDRYFSAQVKHEMESTDDATKHASASNYVLDHSELSITDARRLHADIVPRQPRNHMPMSLLRILSFVVSPASF